MSGVPCSDQWHRHPNPFGCPSCRAGTATFTDETKHQLWTEAECRTMVNAALMYLASISPDGVLRVPLDKIMTMAEQTDGLAMSISEDDKILSIIAQKQQ